MNALLLSCAVVAALAVGTAAAARIEHLGQPCRAKNILSARVITDRATGREQFVLVDMNEDTGAEMIFIDVEKNTGRSYRAPAGSGSWALLEVPGDRLVVGTFYDGKFMVFDLKKMKFIKTVGFPGETYIWNLALGKDGRVYGGSYGHGKLGALDLNDYTVEDCGAPAPPNLYLRYVTSLPDGRILCHFNVEKPTTLAYDPATKKFEPVPEKMQGIPNGLSWNGNFFNGSQAFDGKTLESIAQPFPVPSGEGRFSVVPQISSEDRLYLQQKNAIYLYKKGDKTPSLVCDMDLRSGYCYGSLKNGSLAGVRGQDYFIIKPGDKTVELKPIPVKSGPRPTLFLEVDNSGKLWGGPHFGQTVFWMDPKTKKYENTGKICDAGGEVYDVAFVGDAVYAVTYAGGDIVRYEPNKPWDQWNHKNPVNIVRVGPNYIRPTAGVKVGPDGKLYAGWWAKYGTYGGAVSITDPDTGKTELIENPLGEQGVAGVATDGKNVYVGTTIAANGLPENKSKWSQFGVIDLATRKVLYQETFDGAYSVLVPAYDAKTKRIVALATGGKPRLFDPEKMQFVKDLPEDIPAMTCSSTGARGDGKFYYANEKTLLVMDLATGRTTKIADAPAEVTNVATGPDGTVYFSCGVDVYKVNSK